MGHMGHVGQLSDGSRGSWVTKCDPLSALDRGVEGEGYGGGCPLPIRLWGLGERRITQQGPGGRKRFLVHFEVKKPSKAPF